MESKGQQIQEFQKEVEKDPANTLSRYLQNRELLKKLAQDCRKNETIWVAAFLALRNLKTLKDRMDALAQAESALP